MLYFTGVQQFAHLSGSSTKTIKVFAYFTISLSVISDMLLVYSYYIIQPILLFLFMMQLYSSSKHLFVACCKLDHCLNSTALLFLTKISINRLIILIIDYFIKCFQHLLKLTSADATVVLCNR